MAFLEVDIQNCQLVRVVFPRALVDNSGCPPTQMAMIVLLTEQRTKSDTFMTSLKLLITLPNPQ
jgi:hypothetical protein